jgi:transposase-like protein
MLASRPSPLEVPRHPDSRFFRADQIPVERLSRELGVAPRLPHSGLAPASANHGAYRVDPLTRAEREELARLRQENRRLLQECEFLLAAGGNSYP